MSEDLTRPIIGIEYRTPHEVFDIMCARINAARSEAKPPVEGGGGEGNMASGGRVPASPDGLTDGQHITDDILPNIIERGRRGEKLTPAEHAAWTGYELGWRDGRAESRPETGGRKLTREEIAAISRTCGDA